MHYNNIKIRIPKEKHKNNGKKHDIQFYYTPSTTLDPNNNIVYYFMPNSYAFCLPTYDFFPAHQTSYISHNYCPLSSEQV